MTAPRVLLVVKDNRTAERLRHALQGAIIKSAIDISHVGATIGARRYDRVVVLSMPPDRGSTAQRDWNSEWVEMLRLKLPPGQFPIRIDA